MNLQTSLRRRRWQYYSAAAHSDEFAEILQLAHRDRLSTRDCRWHVIMYNDAVECGNPLAYKHRRKIESVYWSILEFGPTALSNELVWFEVANINECRSLRIQGRMNQVIV